MNEAKLKECPFCGGEAIYDTNENFDERIVCLRCDAQTCWTHYSGKEGKIKEWNTRSQPEPTEEEIERVARAILEANLWPGAYKQANDAEKNHVWIEAKAAISATQDHEAVGGDNPELIKEIENKLIDGLCEYTKDGPSAIKLKEIILQYKKTLQQSPQQIKWRKFPDEKPKDGASVIIARSSPEWEPYRSFSHATYNEKAGGFIIFQDAINCDYWFYANDLLATITPNMKE